MQKETTKPELSPAKLKDFTPGQHAYALYEGDPHQTPKITEVVVVGVGRKYVKAKREMEGDQMAKEYEVPYIPQPYLTEHQDWGYQEKLFKDRATMDLFCRKRTLYRKLRKIFSGTQLDNFTLAELEGVYAIVGGKNSGPAEDWEV